MKKVFQLLNPKPTKDIKGSVPLQAKKFKKN